MNILTIPIPVTVASVRCSKSEHGNSYADFLLVGGSIGVAISRGEFEQLKPLEGSEAVILFQVKPVQFVRFDRSVTVLEPIRFIEVMKSNR